MIKKGNIVSVIVYLSTQEIDNNKLKTRYIFYQKSETIICIEAHSVTTTSTCIEKTDSRSPSSSINKIDTWISYLLSCDLSHLRNPWMILQFIFPYSNEEKGKRN